MNVDQIQSELMSRVRVVWVGAKIPIWLSDFVSLSIKISKYHFCIWDLNLTTILDK